MISVQSGVALNLNPGLPGQVAESLSAIRQASKEGLRELRSVLRILRQDGEPAPHAPPPALARLGDLVNHAAAAGLRVRAETGGTVRELPFGVDQAAFRIMQEALTNVTRHAGTDTAIVRVRYGQHDLTVQVDDDGQGRNDGLPPPGGSGIAGMRDRAAALGGELNAGPRPGADSGSPPRFPWTAANDPGAARRRPGPGPGLARRPGRHRGAGEASEGEQAVSLARQAVPDVVLMDIRMPGTDGLAATRQIAADERLAGVRVVILTTFELDEYVFEAIRSGAARFLVKDTDPDELVQAVRVVADGGALLSPGVTRRLIGEFASRAKPPQPAAVLGELTDREREVLALVGEGLSNAEIAGRLYVSPATAKTHVSRAMVKLGARDGAQLVVIAYESGLVRPGWHGGASPGQA